MRPSAIIPKFDTFLKKRGLTFEGVVIGGAALELLGVISRETQDCDVLDPAIPIEIAEAAKAFAQEMSLPETGLRENWLNNGPSTLVPLLPSGWKIRLSVLFKGDALILHCLCRQDLLATKLLAFCDRGQDLPDCLAMNPSKSELSEIIPWLSLQDGNPCWPAHVQDSLKNLGKKLGYEF
jgi:hypothetical protein